MGWAGSEEHPPKGWIKSGKWGKIATVAGAAACNFNEDLFA